MGRKFEFHVMGPEVTMVVKKADNCHTAFPRELMERHINALGIKAV